MEVIQLFLHLAAQAPAVVTVQPLPHHAQAILTLVLIKGKVLYSGCNTAPSPKGGAYRCSWSSADILAEHTDRGEKGWMDGWILVIVRNSDKFSSASCLNSKFETADFLGTHLLRYRPVSATTPSTANVAERGGDSNTSSAIE